MYHIIFQGGYMYLYQRIKDLREDADLKQSQIAELLVTSQQVYSTYEIGKRQIPVHHLITLAKFYKTSTDYLLGITDKR